MVRSEIIAACLLCIVSQSVGSSDDRFIKKYAMMKIYESCFGPEVVKQIRREMKDAYAKCSSAPSFDDLPNPPPNQQPNIPSILLGKLPPGFAMDTGSQTIIKPQDGALNNLENEFSNQEHASPPAQKMHSGGMGGMGGILAFRPQGPMQPQQPPYPQQVPPFMLNNPQLRFGSPNTPFYQYNPYAAAGLYSQYNPYPYQQQGYNAYYQPPYFGNSRMSRDMDLHDRLEAVSRGGAGGAGGAGGRRNVTCVMQELGYLDARLEPNYEQITRRIADLPVAAELKGDIQDGLQFCQKFSQCIPDVKRDVSPLSQELIKPMFFFRCYKHKKLEACIMKDIRERFTTEEELDTEADFRSLPLSRSARAVEARGGGDPRFDALDEMSVYMYDFLSGGNGLDFDLYL